jgi:hypothetical protein
VLIDADELRRLVREEAKSYKSLADFARSIEVYPSFMGNFLSGEKGPGFKVLARMGYEEVTLYRKIEKE